MIRELDISGNITNIFLPGYKVAEEIHMKILLKLLSYVHCNIHTKSHSNGLQLFELLGEQSPQVWKACLELCPGFFSALPPFIFPA